MRKKYYAVFCNTVQGIHTVLRKKEIFADTIKTQFKNKTYFINIDRPTFSVKNRLYYYININESQIVFDKNSLKSTKGLHPTEVDMIVRREIAKQLFEATVTKPFDWMSLILGAIGGLGIGMVLGGMFL